MRCLVTGASGHLGSHLVRRLVEAGEQVAILVRPESDLWRLGGVLDSVRAIRADLAELDNAAGLICELRPETVFHLAWSGVAREDRNEPDRLIANVAGSLKLFDIASQAGCRRWIGMGSQSEYGPCDGVLREDRPPRPDSGYGVAKNAVRQTIEWLCDAVGIRFVWLRLFATFGPADDSRHLIPAVIDSLLRTRVPALTEGAQRCDYLYVDDAVAALRKAAVLENVRGIYNLASGEPMRVRDIAETIRDLIDPRLPLGFGAIRTGAPVPDLVADVSRFREDAQWSPVVSFSRGLEVTIDWHRNRMEHR